MTKRDANLSVDAALLADAEALGIVLSQTFEASLRAAIRAKRGRRWLDDNRAALTGYNDWIAECGLPLDRYRQF